DLKSPTSSLRKTTFSALCLHTFPLWLCAIIDGGPGSYCGSDLPSIFSKFTEAAEEPKEELWHSGTRIQNAISISEVTVNNAAEIFRSTIKPITTKDVRISRDWQTLRQIIQEVNATKVEGITHCRSIAVRSMFIPSRPIRT